ncbi:MAG: UDP-glucose 4-epimerase GalE [Anaerotignaceae bacterium]
MNVLVTGGNGFIGSHTCVELLGAGYDVVVMDNLSNSEGENIAKIEKITGKKLGFYDTDMLDYSGVDRIFKENKISAVIHFAGLKAVGESVEKPLEYYENNITGTINICKAMRENGCKRMVFSSSATVYGTSEEVPFVETLPTSATNPYGFTKVMIERILKDLCMADNDWSVMLLRYFNPIGAHDSGLIGEKPKGIPNNLLPYISQVALGALPYVSVYGNDYDTQDGTGVRDYIHVADLAVGHIKAMEYLLSHKGSEAVNLGTGRGTSVLEIIRAYEKACGKEIPYKVVQRRQGDVAVCYADTKKAKELLEWEAKFGIERMCIDSWRFTQKG